MSSSIPDAGRVASIMLCWHSLEVLSCKPIQSLWAGYGHICEVTARPTTNEATMRMRSLFQDPSADTFPLILKLISPPAVRPGSRDEGHLRKMLSYEVEQYFYSVLAQQLDSNVPVAHCIVTTRDTQGKPGAELLEGLIATVMTDLRSHYPVAGEKRTELNETQAYAALKWLSAFHKSSWKLLPTPTGDLVLPPLEEAQRREDGLEAGKTVWLNGGYTYLATRRKELASLARDTDSEWASVLCEPMLPGKLPVADMVAKVLTPRQRSQETLIHGDVKSENMFTSKSGQEVVLFDFQYVGLGLGVCDLAKLFTCSVPLHMLMEDANSEPYELQMEKGERGLLELYRQQLLDGVSRDYDWNSFVRHWETALVDWLRFQASWGFWGNTQWLEARVRSILKDTAWQEWLVEQEAGAGQHATPLPN
ncbi:kinase-like domain-containing protein [Xylariomycetidae sp. FL0641]|nr:kinase-like domain-containing protein [Xylariomycetidae sp. FL0641]